MMRRGDEGIFFVYHTLSADVATKRIQAARITLRSSWWKPAHQLSWRIMGALGDLASSSSERDVSCAVTRRIDANRTKLQTTTRHKQLCQFTLCWNMITEATRLNICLHSISNASTTGPNNLTVNTQV
mmetsp:Transcript_72501/g.132783  ORF Transcript_72501/g.132783 Transcript_72501/m.132783 type:complete len:128 (+) Transcript_72501:3-386(+)